MSVIKTDIWFANYYDKPIKLCKKLEKYFDKIPASEIHDFLAIHGMYEHPFENKEKFIKHLQKMQQIISKEERQLLKIWDAPNIPIFIFPSEPRNERLKTEFNGRAGIAFPDKLFLFICEINTPDEIRALFVHEYNHVCRLAKFNKNESNYRLLDTIILEGLAEHAVKERLGQDFLGHWLSFYCEKELREIWEKIVFPHRNILRSDRKYQQILYGSRIYPKMGGYCVGYYLVKKFIKKTKSQLRI